MRSIILFEINEVPFSIIDHYAKKYPSSTLAKILPVSDQLETHTEDEGHLHPWTTWPTLHRGIDNSIHKIKDIGEDLSALNEKHPPIWQILQQNNIKTGVYSSLHSYPLPKNVEKYEFFIPDPFAWGPETHPISVQPFQAFNLAMVKNSARNVDSGFEKTAALKLGLKLPTLGIKPKTIISVIGQLIEEKKSAWKVTRRRTFQSVMAFDVFLKLLKKKKPQFCTFFSNHVAATMHRYWAAAFPSDYNEYHLSDDWKNKYAEEVDFAMSKFDEFLSQLVDFIEKNKEYKLLIVSSMGQHATKAMEQKSEILAKDILLFLNKLGFGNHEFKVLPAMHPQYNITFESDERRAALIQQLNLFDILGKPLQHRIKENGFISIDFGHMNLEDGDIIYNGQSINLAEFGLENEAIQDEASGTAYHIPEGTLIVYDPIHNSKSDRQFKVNTKRIVPSILNNFGIEVPDYMDKNLISSIKN